MTSTPILQHYIGGERVAAPPKFDSLNPSNTNDIVARVPDGDAAAVDAAVSAALKAFPSWSESTGETRSDILERISTLIFQRKDELAKLLAREEGKTVPESTGEVLRAARIFRFFSGEALRRSGTTVESTRAGVDAATYREAVGVFGLIAPWNFPIAIPAWKSAPALAFGNTVVLKPSELTSALASALADIVHEAGMPKGVFNVVFGAGAAGRALVEHPNVTGISFTGSQSTGARIAKTAAARQARMQLEMGGKNALVVLDDADIERAVQCALDGAFFATGQRCTASSRLIVTDGVHDRFVQRLSEKINALRVGDALDAETQVGPLASEQQIEKSRFYLNIAQQEGARQVAGGNEPRLSTPGYYFRPALLVDTQADMRVNSEEIFGPIASVLRVANYDAALAAANAGSFGLSAGIVTASLKYSRHFTHHVRAGMVMVNLPTAGVDYHVPFGGSRKSSYGPREQGSAAIEFYTQIKTAYTWA
jgi:acyl-CoA reductase-like NAD-dependent aldehyde dehydrogenase